MSRKKKVRKRLVVANSKKFLLKIVLPSLIVVSLILYFIFVHFSGTYDSGIVSVGPFTEITATTSNTHVSISHYGDGKPYKEEISLPYNTGVSIVTDICIEKGSITLD